MKVLVKKKEKKTESKCVKCNLNKWEFEEEYEYILKKKRILWKFKR